jgi:hypothetical protein
VGVEKCTKRDAKGFSFSFPIENTMPQLYQSVMESCSLVVGPSNNLSHPDLFTSYYQHPEKFQHERAYACSKDRGPNIRLCQTNKDRISEIIGNPWKSCMYIYIYYYYYYYLFIYPFGDIRYLKTGEEKSWQERRLIPMW